MNDHMGESSTTTKTFHFGSGQFLTLSEDQIGKIPYLTALVSAGPSFDSIQLNKGYYLLDSRIDYQDFQFALDSISFHSIRQIFIRLPKNYNTLAIIALLDFLAIGPERDPTLDEVNSSFFWNVKFGDKLGTYKFIYSSSHIQDMAVRFAIALAKEEYDFRSHQVIDQIYWFIMFILSAHKLFETHIRYHVHKIAKNCFSLFCPFLLERLYRIEERTEKEIRDNSIAAGTHINFHKETDALCSFNVFPDDCSCNFWRIDPLCTVSRLGLTFKRCVPNDMLRFWRWRRNSLFFTDCRKISYNKDKNLERLCEKVLENMYKCLLGIVLDQEPIKNCYHNFATFNEVKYKLILDDILNCSTVQAAIQENILSEICELTPTLERAYAELMKEIQAYEQNPTTTTEDEMYIYPRYLFWKIDKITFESKPDQALKCELTLNKLYQYESIIDEIRNTILADLHDLFMDEIKIFVNSRSRQWSLFSFLLTSQDKKTQVSELKKTHKMKSGEKYRPSPKIQCKYARR
ncbi:unnamed protein product [Rotaria socialis]|uniref:Uncharacterized protein n=2 Tax=Rotaria socialis TaxID=392032 RepID=A0A820X057_9BILA|nr:unnamed protein product [Rotaria socialis]